MAAIDEEISISEPTESNDTADISNYSGQFQLRIPKNLHKRLATEAKREGISMNQYCNYLLTMNEAMQKGNV